VDTPSPSGDTTIATLPGDTPQLGVDHGAMDMRYQDALATQRRREERLTVVGGVSAVGAKRRGKGLVLELSMDPAAEIPLALDIAEIDGLPLVVVPLRYEVR
jgi:hypothetical protein